MGEVVLSMGIGYLFGLLSPAALISMIKKKNLKENGTGNLGATNTMLVFGKKYGAIVMVIDILKAFISVKFAKWLFPNLAIAGLLAGCCTVIAHIFPLHLKFKGGKGLASFGGMILAVDPGLFLILLTLGIILILITNYGVALPISATVLAPFLAGVRMRSMSAFGVLFVVGAVILYKHGDNFERIREGSEIKVRDFIRGHMHK